MTIQLRNFSSETIYVQDVLFIANKFTTKLFLQIFLKSVIYETFPIRTLLCIQYTPYSWSNRTGTIDDVKGK